MIQNAGNAASAAIHPLGTSRTQDDPAKIKDAARQFEALLIGQMVKAMQPEDGSWLGGEDSSSSAAMEYGQEVFAQALSANGGLGLASLVAKGLTR